MFKPGIQRVTRIIRTFAVVLFAATMLPIAGQAATEEPVDFSAGLLFPADYAEFGFDDYGIDSGRFFSLPQMIRDSGNPDWDDPEYAETGIDQVYGLFVHPIGGLDANSGPDINFANLIFVYEDEDAAEDGWEIYEDESDDPTATDLDDAPDVGDESEMTEYVDEWQEDGRTWEYHGIDMSFRLGNVVANVTANGYDEEVDRDDIEAIGEYFAEKLTALIEDGEIDGSGAPELALVIPRYEADELMPSRSHYCAIGGEALPQAYDPGAAEFNQERIDRFDMVASYCNLQKLFYGSEPEEYLLLNIEPLQFAKSRGAAEYIETTIDETSEGNSTYEAVELDLDDLSFEADEAWAISYEHSFGDYDLQVTEIVVRDGKFVYEVRLSGFEAPEVEAMLDITTDLFSCVEETCRSTFDLPESILEFIEEQSEIYGDL